MSKFDCGVFVGGYDDFAVSKQRYTKEEAIEMAQREYEWRKEGYVAIGNGYVRHRAGMNEDNEPQVGWWLEYEEHKRSCPCWIFHYTKNKDENFNEDYEYIQLIK